MKQDVNILVLDQATISSGMCLLNVRDGVPYWNKCARWKLTQDDYQERLVELFEKVTTEIEAEDIGVLVLEQVPPIIKNFNTTSVLLKLLGTLELAGNRRGCEVVLMNVHHWKKMAGIKSKGRNPQKAESIRLACERWKQYKNLIRECDDVADALNMSYAYLKDEGYIKK